MIELIKDIFNKVYMQIYGFEYHFKNDKVEKLIKDFIDKININVGEQWLLDFIIFQFSYYDGMKTRFDRVYLNWIFGDKAIERWENRTEQQVYFANEFRRKLGINREFDKLNIKEHNEREKLRFTDINDRLLYCDELSLFSDSSDICKCCINYQICYNHVRRLC